MILKYKSIDNRDTNSNATNTNYWCCFMHVCISVLYWGKIVIILLSCCTLPQYNVYATMIDQGNFSVMSLNVRGLRNQFKRKSIFRFLRDQNCLIHFLQEIYPKPSAEIIWKCEWGGDIFFSHGSTHSTGVCILIDPLYVQTANNFNKDQNGRIVSFDIVSAAGNFSVCNVYVPNELQQMEFLQCLDQYLMSNTDTANLVIASDSNVDFMPLTKRQGTVETKYVS